MIPNNPFDLVFEYLACTQPPGPADVVIAFGSYHLPVAKTAAELVINGYAPLLVCTGSNTGLTKHLVEADYFANEALALGLSEDQIIREPTATNTSENISATLALLHEKNVHVQTVLVCAIPYHLRRIVVTFAKVAPDVCVIPILVPFSRDDYQTKNGLTFEQRLAGEIDRLQSYPQLGYTIPLDIPAEVDQAAYTLVA